MVRGVAEKAGSALWQRIELLQGLGLHAHRSLGSRLDANGCRSRALLLLLRYAVALLQ